MELLIGAFIVTGCITLIVGMLCICFIAADTIRDIIKDWRKDNFY